MKRLLPIVALVSSSVVLVNCQKENLENKKLLTGEIANKSNNPKKLVPKIKKNALKDIDGNKYSTVMIGDKEWMAENLKVTHYRNGDPISNITDNLEWGSESSGAWCNYQNSSTNGQLYGKLYNWYAVDDPRGIAPAGWHVATWNELRDLALAYSSSSSLSDYVSVLYEAAPALKSTGTIEAGDGLWHAGTDPETEGTNSSGFSGLPGGHREINGSFSPDLGSTGNWWCATNYDNANAYWMFIQGSSKDIIFLPIPKTLGFSVRCVKN